MPRSYSFDHFTAVKPDASKLAVANASPHPVKSETALPVHHEALHYGQQHSQTVLRLQERRMDRQAEQRLDEESAEMDELPPEPVAAPPRRQRVVTRRAAPEPTPAKRTVAKKAVAKRAPAKKKAAQGTKRLASPSAAARTARAPARAPKKPAAKAKTKTSRSPAPRSPKKR